MKDDKKIPLISVITITYNAGRELPVTMESLALQNFEDFEHLIIDGASTDNTLEIAESYCKPNQTVVSEPDKGLYDAMNKGLKLAKGKYIIFLNAGDTFHTPGTLTEYAVEAHKDRDIIYGYTIIVDSNRDYISPRHLTAPEKLTYKSFSKGMLVCHQAFMVKKSIAPFYDLNYKYSADYKWTIDCIKNSNPDNNINLDNVTIDYLKEGVTTRNHFKSLIERFRIMCDYYGMIPTMINHAGFLLRMVRRRAAKKLK